MYLVHKLQTFYENNVASSWEFGESVYTAIKYLIRL
jgi:hypothetical protein